MGVSEEEMAARFTDSSQSLHLSWGAVCHTAGENCCFPFSPEEESRSKLLSQERTQELLLQCQQDSPETKCAIFAA